MNNTKHSPLPWIVRPYGFDDWGWIRGSDGNLACIARGHDDKPLDEHRHDGTDPYAANADLIVRSVNSIPDLVKALEELLRVSAEETCTHKEFGEAVAAARAALSKYRGVIRSIKGASNA